MDLTNQEAVQHALEQMSEFERGRVVGMLQEHERAERFWYPVLIITAISVVCIYVRIMAQLLNK